MRDTRVSMCDPNRNFADRTPIFTRAFLEQLAAGQPVIALPTAMVLKATGRVGAVTLRYWIALHMQEVK